MLIFNIAKEIAALSYAEKKKVGCIIVKDDNIMSYGFNGMPNGLDNSCEYVNENNELKTKKEVLRAESNAITKLTKTNNSCLDATIYLTIPPCIDCAKLIIQSGIKRVVYKDYYKDDNGIELLKLCNIEIEQI